LTLKYAIKRQKTFDRFILFGRMRVMIMSEFNEAVARVPALWGRKVVSVLEVANGMASVRVSGNVHGFWVPVEKLERVGHVPARTIATRQPRKRSEVC
jgi:hypothetical protein